MSEVRSHSDEPEERPSWLLPLILFGITGAIAAVFLFWFLAPDVNEVIGISATPTTDAETVEVRIGNQVFDVPTNYIHLPAARSGGAMKAIQLDALLPDLHGYAEGDEDAIRDVSRLSPAVTITLSAGAPEMNERERFERIYRRHAAVSKGPYAHAGFDVTPLTSESGYAGQSAFTRDVGGQLVVVLCSADDPESETGGLCQRETSFGQDVTLVYAFRKGHLENWAPLDKAVHDLIGRFARQP